MAQMMLNISRHYNGFENGTDFAPHLMCFVSSRLRHKFSEKIVRVRTLFLKHEHKKTHFFEHPLLDSFGLWIYIGWSGKPAGPY